MPYYTHTIDRNTRVEYGMGVKLEKCVLCVIVNKYIKRTRKIVCLHGIIEYFFFLFFVFYIFNLTVRAMSGIFYYLSFVTKILTINI